MESAAFGRLTVSLPQMGKVAPQATDGMIDVSPALSVNVSLRIQLSIISVPHLSWDGKVPAKPGKRLLNAARHK